MPPDIPQGIGHRQTYLGIPGCVLAHILGAVLAVVVILAGEVALAKSGQGVLKDIQDMGEQFWERTLRIGAADADFGKSKLPKLIQLRHVISKSPTLALQPMYTPH